MVVLAAPKFVPWGSSWATTALEMIALELRCRQQLCHYGCQAVRNVQNVRKRAFRKISSAELENGCQFAVTQTLETHSVIGVAQHAFPSTNNVMFNVHDSDSDDDYTSRQHKYMRPWGNRALADGYGRNAALADPGSEEWERRGYRDNAQVPQGRCCEGSIC